MNKLRPIPATSTVVLPTAAVMQTPVGLPTDGTWGLNNIAEIEPTDELRDAIDKVETLIERSLDFIPDRLSDITLTLVDTTYTARGAGEDTQYTNVQNNATQKPRTNTTAEFYTSNQGTLSASVKDTASSATTQGEITFTSGSDVGIDDYLEIVTDEDPYAGIPGQEGIFKTATARIGGTADASALSPGTTPYTFQMINVNDEGTFSTPVLTFYQDDAYSLTPAITVSGGALGIYDVSWASTQRVSGVPTLTTTDTFSVRFTATDCIGKFYNNTWVAQISGNIGSTATQLPTGSDRDEGANPTFEFTGVNPADNIYNENFSVVCTCRGSDGTTATDNATGNTGNVRVDIVSLQPSSATFINEADSGDIRRRQSGTGQYPALTDQAYDPDELLSTNEELQLLNGIYQYPPAVDYSARQPAGPDYSALAAGSFNNMRWATFRLGTSVTAITSVTVTIAGATNFGSDVVVSDFEMYVRIIGGVGWYNGNASPQDLAPTTQGDNVLDIGNSTVTVRRLSFGATPVTGVLYIRIGIPEGDNKTFTGISYTTN